jgi:hypothetical protein
MFLPTWPAKDKVAPGSNSGGPGVNILLRNFEEHENRYQKLIDQWDKRFCKVKCPVSALLDMKKEFSLGQNGCVNHLFVFTHGLSHTIDPYASSLTFADDDLRLRQLLSSDQASLDIYGAGVLLGACEADMMPPQLTIVDEHLSFSTAFLEKGASQVLSGLYQVFDTRLKELAMALKTNNVPLYQALWAWHERKCRGFGEQLREKLFFEIAPFRVLGYPRKEQRNPMQTGPTDE